MRRAQLLSMIPLLCGCPTPTATPFVQRPAGDGVVSVWPKNGDADVPLRSPLVFQFSAPPTLALSESPCMLLGATATGRLCVLGPNGPISGAAVVNGNTLTFTPDAALAAGATYQSLLSESLLPGATNLEGGKALTTFRARDERPKAKASAKVVSFNGQPFDAPQPSSAKQVLDVDSLRLLFSEPLHVDTVSNLTVRLIEVDNGGTEKQMPAGVLCDGIHLTVDPLDDLDETKTYLLTTAPEMKDFGGEPVPPLRIEFKVIKTSDANGERFNQTLAVAPPWTPNGTPGPSAVAALPANTGEVSSSLIGNTPVGLFGPTISAQLGEPKSLGGPIPLVIRKGQRLDLSGLDIRIGGIVSTGRKTATQHLTFLNDAVGFLARNPLRAGSQFPDDEQSPVAVDLVLDAALTAEDLSGNILSNQTVMGIVLHGTSRVEGKRFAVDQFSAIELNALGIGRATVNMSLRLQTGATVAMDPLSVPRLVSTLPAEGAKEVSPLTAVQFNFSGPIDSAQIAMQPLVTMSQKGASVPVVARADGATFIVKPLTPLLPGEAVTVTLGQLLSPTGETVELGAAAKLTFTTVAKSAAPPVAPYVVSLVPGAPCALERGTTGSPGTCVGAEKTDAPYQPFRLSEDKFVEAQFSQPMDPKSFKLGESCGEGSVRVERLDAQGKCVDTVSGSLIVGEQSMRFIPSAPWINGQVYRLVLVGGADDRCAAGELCSLSQKPLSTDILRGIQGTSGGGPAIEIGFVTEPATTGSFLPLLSWPKVDLNGDGVVNGEESVRDETSAAIEVADFGGIISRAELSGPDCRSGRPQLQNCLGLNSSIPVSVNGPIDKCPVDAAGMPIVEGKPCIEVRVYPSLILGTNVTLNTTALGIIPINNISTGTLIIRILETAAPLNGYIISEDGLSDPQFVIRQELLIDAPDLSILGGAVSNDLKSKPIVLTFKGPVAFLPDGRMEVRLKSLNAVDVRVNVRALFAGHVTLRIPAGEMRLNLVGPTVR